MPIILVNVMLQFVKKDAAFVKAVSVISEE
jgi:hypothetical protein